MGKTLRKQAKWEIYKAKELSGETNNLKIGNSKIGVQGPLKLIGFDKPLSQTVTQRAHQPGGITTKPTVMKPETQLNSTYSVVKSQMQSKGKSKVSAAFYTQCGAVSQDPQADQAITIPF